MVTLKSELASVTIRSDQDHLPRLYQEHISHSKPSPGPPSPHRSVHQVDPVPTLSLLGLPTHFSNLGTVIPELLWWDRMGSDCANVLDINAQAYFNAYQSSPSGGEPND